MPFKSEKQRKYMFANKPEIAKKWSKEYNQGGVASMFRKKLSKGTELLEVYRGETINLNPFRSRSSVDMNPGGKIKVGKYATTAADEAINYASKKFPNFIKTAKITPRDFKIGRRVFNEVTSDFSERPNIIMKIANKIKDFTRDRSGQLGYNILSKKNKNKLKIDILKTIASNAKALTPLAIKGLSYAASLPAQIVLMTLSPTKMGDGELKPEDLEQLTVDEANYKLEQLAKVTETAEKEDKEDTEKEEMAQGGVASMFRKKQADGTDPNYEGWKKIYETNPDLAALNDKHDEYLEKYTLEMSTSDAGEAGILGTEEANMEFVEVDDGEEVMVDDRINLMAAAPEKQPFLSSDQSATTLFMNKGGLTNYLKENAPKGEFLAYINPDEATMLKKAGGSGKLVNGIPSFEPRSSREADQKSSKSSGGDGKANIGDISGPTKTETKTETKTDAREDYRTKQYTTGPKTRTINETITTP